MKMIMREVGSVEIEHAIQTRRDGTIEARVTEVVILPAKNKELFCKSCGTNVEIAHNVSIVYLDDIMGKADALGLDIGPKM